jgi:hypothetical protein
MANLTPHRLQPSASCGFHPCCADALLRRIAVLKQSSGRSDEPAEKRTMALDTDVRARPVFLTWDHRTGQSRALTRLATSSESAIEVPGDEIRGNAKIALVRHRGLG